MVLNGTLGMWCTEWLVYLYHQRVSLREVVPNGTCPRRTTLGRIYHGLIYHMLEAILWETRLDCSISCTWRTWETLGTCCNSSNRTDLTPLKLDVQVGPARIKNPPMRLVRLIPARQDWPAFQTSCKSRSCISQPAACCFQLLQFSYWSYFGLFHCPRQNITTSNYISSIRSKSLQQQKTRTWSNRTPTVIGLQSTSLTDHFNSNRHRTSVRFVWFLRYLSSPLRWPQACPSPEMSTDATAAVQGCSPRISLSYVFKPKVRTCT